MKTFLGNMHDYIYETTDVAVNIIKNRKEITKDFVDLVIATSPQLIIITGAGTSNFSATTVRRFFEKQLGIQTQVVLPSQFIDEMFLTKPNSMMIGISATGTSKNTMDALRKAKEKGMTCIAATNDPNSPFGQENEHLLFIDHGVEDCSPKSKSYICEIVTLMLCAIETAYATKKMNEQQYQQILERMIRTVKNLTYVATESDRWFDRNESEMKACERMIVVGYNDNFGNIQEGALKILECGRIQTAFYELEEFMHGIYHSIRQDTYLVYLAYHNHHQQRCLKLRDYCSEFTQHNFVISASESDENSRNLSLNLVEDEDFYVLEYMIPLQILAYRMAISKGINPNKPSDPLFHQKMNSKLI